MKILLNLFLLILASQISFGQEYQYDEDNWLGEMGYYQDFLRHVYPNKLYTKEDVNKAKEKFSLIKNSNSNDEWEGYYQQSGELNQYGLIWDSTSGFIRYNIYTCAIELRGIWFGNTVNTSDSVTFNYEKPIYYFYPKKKKVNQENLIKVKIGEKHFLVPKRRLKDFCEYAVGLGRFYDIENVYWQKVSNREKKSSGLPILPEKYKHFLAHPIQGKIKQIGKIEIQRSKNPEGKIETDGVTYNVILNIGKKNNVSKEMEFYIPEIQDTVTIEKAYTNYSIGYIWRRINDNKEICENKDSEKIPCPQISVGMTVKTIMAFDN